MRGLGGIKEALLDLLQLAGVPIHPWTLPALVIILAGLFSPWILANLRTGSARSMLKRARVLEGEERKAMEARAMAEVRGNPYGYIAIAEESIRLGRLELARQAVQKLAETGKARPHLRRLRAELDPDDLPHTVDAAVVVIDQFIDSGLLGRAAERLEKAHKKYGDKRELTEAEDRLAEARSQQAAPG